MHQLELARICRVSQAHVSQIENGKAFFPDYIRDRLLAWLKGPQKVSSNQDDSEIRSGSELRDLLKKLGESGVTRAKVAQGCYVKLASLEQYRYLPEGKLPKKFRKNLKAFLQTI